MKRALVIYRCGAESEVLYPEDDPGALERKRRDAAAHDCPYCSGDERREGAQLLVGDGGIDLWRWRDVTAAAPGRQEDEP